MEFAAVLRVFLSNRKEINSSNNEDFKCHLESACVIPQASFTLLQLILKIPLCPAINSEIPVPSWPKSLQKNSLKQLVL